MLPLGDCQGLHRIPFACQDCTNGGRLEVGWSTVFPFPILPYGVTLLGLGAHPLFGGLLLAHLRHAPTSSQVWPLWWWSCAGDQSAYGGFVVFCVLFIAPTGFSQAGGGTVGECGLVTPAGCVAAHFEEAALLVLCNVWGNSFQEVPTRGSSNNSGDSIFPF